MLREREKERGRKRERERKREIEIERDENDRRVAFQRDREKYNPNSYTTFSNVTWSLRLT